MYFAVCNEGYNFTLHHNIGFRKIQRYKQYNIVLTLSARLGKTPIWSHVAISNQAGLKARWLTNAFWISLSALSIEAGSDVILYQTRPLSGLLASESAQKGAMT